jgi:hypothetical protein
LSCIIGCTASNLELGRSVAEFLGRFLVSTAAVAEWLLVVEHLYDGSMFEELSGAQLAIALAGVDVGSLEADAALGYALAAARLAGWAAAAEGAGLAQLRDRYPTFESAANRDLHHLDTDRLVAAEVRTGYGCSQIAASAKINFAVFLRDIPAVAEALAAGVIRLEHARLLARETAPLAGDPLLQAAVIRELLAANAVNLDATGSGWTMRQWVLRTARAVLQADPSRAEQAAADTRAERHVWHSTDTAHAHGIFGVSGPVEQTAACHTAVDTLARQWQTDGRAGSLDQLRFDAAHALLTGTTTGAAQPDGGARPAGGGLVGQVTIPLSALVGVDDTPGELAGVGPVPASVARELMAQAAVWERLLTDPVDRHVVVQDVKTYRPTEAMRRFVRARGGGVCAGRGCGHRHHLQADHVIPWPAGPTSVANLAPLCPADHNAKTHTGWTHTLDPESGALTQTSPLGRVYTTGPASPVTPTGRRADPPRLRPDLIGVNETHEDGFFPSGEPPPDPAEEETAPPDLLGDTDRWPIIARTIARRQFDPRPVLALAAVWAEAAERKLIDKLHAEAEASTDYQLIAAINAEYLAEDNAQDPPEYLAA